MTPFIVTAKRPERDGDTHHWCGFGPDHDGPCPPLDEAGRVVSCVAVATLEEAREMAKAEVVRCIGTKGWFGKSVHEQYESLPDSGGMIGPLPDGTLIEVRQVSWDDILRNLDVSGEEYERLADTNLTRDADVIAAFNAREAGHA